jgi:hypothetical protein
LPTDPPPDPGTVAAIILDLVRARGAGETICPSEAARRLAADAPTSDPDPAAWRALMSGVRAAAARFREQGLIVVTQRGRAVDPLDAKGPIRLGLPSPED